MKRSEFITLLGGAAVWPLAARAQLAGKLPTIGLLGPTTASAMAPWIAVFVRRLRELGWIEGRTVVIEYRWAEARTERFAEIAAEFVRLKVDVIVTYASAPVLERFPKRLNRGFPCRREYDSSSLLGGGQHEWRSRTRRTCVGA